MENNVFKDNVYSCDFCNSTFALKRTLYVHLKSSKRCIEKRPKIDLSCIWCSMKFSIKEELDKKLKIVNDEVDELQGEYNKMRDQQDEISSFIDFRKI